MGHEALQFVEPDTLFVDDRTVLHGKRAGGENAVA
jgi:hypothetical protein